MQILKHIGPRLHRFIYGFFRTSDQSEVQEAERQFHALLHKHNVATEQSRLALYERITEEVSQTLNLGSEATNQVAKMISDIVDYEEFFQAPNIDLSAKHTTADLWAAKDLYANKIETLKSFSKLEDALSDIALFIASEIKQSISSSRNLTGDPDGIIVPVRRIDAMANLPEFVERIIGAPFDANYAEAGIFNRMRERLDYNLIIASGGNPNDPNAFNKTTRLPTKFDAKTPDELVNAYLSRTPLRGLFDGDEEFLIPQNVRFEHHHIIAGTGHGKTQTLQFLLSEDLKAVERGERSIVVIDSQLDLIDQIRRLEIFAPGGALHDKLCVIDPSDVEYPVSLNLFDVGQERLKEYSLADRERLTNSILELYDFVLSSLLSAGMTQKQDVVFRYVTRLMLHIPNATIDTFRQLMEPGSEKVFAEHIQKLEGSARRFFETEFAGKEFVQTRSQVLRRLYGILENQTFERMFSNPRSKFDMYDEINAGRVILINTSKDFLKENGTGIFGRFFIALIAQAAQERAVLPVSKRMPTMIYIDEAADYFDQNIATILSQARKYKVGMVLSHQYLGQLDGKLLDAFSANTSIKFAGGFAGREARSAAQYIGCEPDLFRDQKKGSFVTFIKGQTKAAINLKFPPFAIDKAPKMSAEEYEILTAKIRDRYAIPISKHKKKPPSDDDMDGGGNDGGDGGGTPNNDKPWPVSPDGGVDIDPKDSW